MHHNPRRSIVIVLLDLAPRNVLLRRVSLRHFRHCRCGKQLRMLRRQLLRTQRVHPSTLRRTGHRWVLKAELGTVRARLRVNLHFEMRVVPHAHQVPGQHGGLRVVRLVPRTAHHLTSAHGRLEQTDCLDFQRPEHPAVIPTVLGGVREFLLRTLHFAQLPLLPAVEGDLHACNLAPTARVRVSAHLVLRVGRDRAQFQTLVMVRVRHCRLNVEFIEEVLRLEPPAFLLCQLRVDVRRHDSVIEKVVVIVRRLFSDCDFLQPLNHSSANPPWNDHAHWVTVVRREARAVVLVRDHDLAKRVHGKRNRNRRAVLPIREILSAHKAHVFCLRHIHTRHQQQIPQTNSSPDVRPHRARAPAEPNRLLRHVLLFPSVPSANQRDGQRRARQRRELVHRQVHWMANKPSDGELMCVP
mmetsp:Transcript_11234/g.24175  ORF Transcript_11234/g.24175 Transcript_11234/m.24175 type:complete len:412 (-) Transcript_11234:590-1825(-)